MGGRGTGTVGGDTEGALPSAGDVGVLGPLPPSGEAGGAPESPSQLGTSGVPPLCPPKALDVPISFDRRNGSAGRFLPWP